MTRDDDDLVFNFDQKDDGNDYDDGQPAVDQDIQDQQEDDSHTTDGYFLAPMKTNINDDNDDDDLSQAY